MLFDAAKCRDRRDKLRKSLKGLHADSLLVTNFTNVSYLTGFSGDDSFLLLHPGGELILTDPRYTQQLDEECPGLELVVREPGMKMHEVLGDTLRASGVRKLALEAASVSLAQLQQWREQAPEVDFIATTGLVEEQREVKDKDEVTAIREAIRVAERAFGVVRSMLRPEMTEKAVADELEHQIRLFGGTCSSFPAIVGVGPRGALPHGRPGNSRIEESDCVLIDWGARKGFYISDLTRVLATGKIPPKLERVYNVVLTAQLRAIDAIKPGAILKDVDAAARNVIAQAGFGKQFGHSLGHGIGLQVHEGPRLACDQERPLKAGMVVTVEPGIYIPGWGGVRIEDDVLVTRGGHEVLSHVPKELAQCVVAS